MKNANARLEQYVLAVVMGILGIAVMFVVYIGDVKFINDEDQAELVKVKEHDIQTEKDNIRHEQHMQEIRRKNTEKK